MAQCQVIRRGDAVWQIRRRFGNVMAVHNSLVLGCGSLVRLPQVLELFKKLNGDCPSLFKADVDSAFRRIPVKPEERWMCGIAFMVDGEVWWAQHLACPFGAVGSVHGWERVGAAAAHVARLALMLPVHVLNHEWKMK